MFRGDWIVIDCGIIPRDMKYTGSLGKRYAHIYLAWKFNLKRGLRFTRFRILVEYWARVHLYLRKYCTYIACVRARGSARVAFDTQSTSNWNINENLF